MSPNFTVAANCNWPSYRLTVENAVNVWLRYWSGEYQNRIAASFDVNSAGVNEVFKGHRHIGSEDHAREIAARDAA